MSTRPIDRIAAAILLSGQSKRSLSKSAKLGVNAVSQLFTKEQMPGHKGLSALCDVLSIDMGWVLTGTPRNPSIDTLLEIVDGLSFDEKSKVVERLASREKLTLDELRSISEEAQLPFDALQSWVIGKEAQPSDPASVAAFDELAMIANGNELNSDLLMEALEEAYQIEREVYGKLGPAATRAKLVKRIYALKISGKSDSQ